MRHLPVNDIQIPVRVEVKSRNQMLQAIRAAHNFRDAIEIRVKGTNLVYYICAMDEVNQLARKMVLRKAAQALRDVKPEELINRVLGDDKIPAHIFKGMEEVMSMGRDK